jgi:hypothetical protein
MQALGPSHGMDNAHYEGPEVISAAREGSGIAVGTFCAAPEDALKRVAALTLNPLLQRSIRQQREASRPPSNMACPCRGFPRYQTNTAPQPLPKTLFRCQPRTLRTLSSSKSLRRRVRRSTSSHLTNRPTHLGSHKSRAHYRHHLWIPGASSRIRLLTIKLQGLSRTSATMLTICRAVTWSPCINNRN